MATYSDMSLDDIIQKKKRQNIRPKSKMKTQVPIKKQNVIDARNKIISKKRTHIVDAREKLAEMAKLKDARIKLEELRARKGMARLPDVNSQYHRKYTHYNHPSRKERVFTDSSRQVVSQPLNVKPVRRQNFNNRKFMGDRSIESRMLAKPTLKPIIRTVENDIEIVDEPMEDKYDISRTISNRKASLQLKIVTQNNNAFRSATIAKEKSPPRPPSILKKRPMAALRSENKVEKLEKPATEFRIIVSNLRSSVTAGDIEELFGDVGGMVESRLVRPGTAEVIYKTLEDAQQAVELYHNRQLDKQPMNCLLVTPRTTAPTHSSTSNKPALYSTNSNVEPDISTFHKVLFKTWLNSNILSHELFDNRYTVYRRDRESVGFQNKKDGGGVLIAVYNKYISKRMSIWESDCEDVWVTLEICSKKSGKFLKHNIAFCAVYLPPPVSRSSLESYLDNSNAVCEQNLYTCILGDFNMSYINWPLLKDNNDGYIIPGLGSHLLDFMYLHKLSQANVIPNKSNKILDLVLTNITCKVYESSNALTAIDLLHPPLEVVLSVTDDIKLPFKIDMPKPNYRRADYDAICKYLQQQNWEDIFKEIADVDSMLKIFYDILNIAIQKFVPFTIKHKQNKSPPWFDRNLKRILNEKNAIRWRYKLYQNPMDEIALKLVSDRATRLASVKYNRYVKDLEVGITNNPKLFWSFIKAKKGGKGVYPAHMSNGDIDTSDGTEICNLFAKQFSYNSNDRSSAEDSSKYLGHIRNNGQLLTIPTITSESVLASIKSIDRTKGAGPDGIPPSFILSCASSLALPLSVIF
ncbi:jg16412 [Pararge aegeria aegeria]|uniref:Jg16412 protein n=1 Tax=Pararge aegeria aegeria TaxID=348720 RepID=A0A8S4S9Z2_9NEOP|nr:jg16412 [Pararge aegeria aegeria]